jgi:hypothetical protein
MEKEVVPWFQMLSRNHPFQSWLAFTRSLELEFGPSPYESSRASLFKLQHTSSVSDYYLEFTALANRSQGVSIEALLDCFIGGLKPEIRRDVIALTPHNIPKVVSLAKLFDEKYQSKPKPQIPTAASKFTPNPYTTQKSPLPALLPTPTQKPLTTQNRQPFVKRMSPAEAQLRRAKGLCYTCEEKFTLDHKCPNRTYLFFTTGEGEGDGDPTVESVEPETTTEIEHHLSFNVLKGSRGLGTLRFQGSIQGVEVQILLDSGSSDNFLQPRIANCLKLPIQAAESFKVLVGNGHSLTAEGFVENLQVQVQGHTLQLPVYLLPVTGADLMLGATWLATLGPHIADFSNLSLKFYLGDKFVTLHGDKPSLPAPAQFHHIRRLSQTQYIAEYYAIHVHSMSPNPIVPDTSQLPTALQTLLSNYADVFATPKGLPPPRLQDHAIPLVEGSNPVKVRPYRYPHSQKSQIESMVHDMLQEGIIQPSTSPFSSPVLLIRKKDGS